MAKKKVIKQTSKTAPLVVESHPASYAGYPFITLIQYRNQHFLTIVDNADDECIKAFVLDMCGPEKVNEEVIIEVAAHWYKNNGTKYPISIEFSRLGLTTNLSKIYRTYNIEFVSRIIGPVPRFDMTNVKSVKRRRRKAISPGIKVIKNLR
jgi:hypothetical protein